MLVVLLNIKIKLCIHLIDIIYINLIFKWMELMELKLIINMQILIQQLKDMNLFYY